MEEVKIVEDRHKLRRLLEGPLVNGLAVESIRRPQLCGQLLLLDQLIKIIVKIVDTLWFYESHEIEIDNINHRGLHSFFSSTWIEIDSYFKWTLLRCSSKYYYALDNRNDSILWFIVSDSWAISESKQPLTSTPLMLVYNSVS